MPSMAVMFWNDPDGSRLREAVERLGEVSDSLVIDTTRLDARGEGELLCFLVLAPGVAVAQVEPRLRRVLRSELSPRHVPDRFISAGTIPRTLNGKKCEVPVKKILGGLAPDQAVSRAALQNPEALDPFVAMATAGRR